MAKIWSSHDPTNWFFLNLTVPKDVPCQLFDCWVYHVVLGMYILPRDQVVFHRADVVFQYLKKNLKVLIPNDGTFQPNKQDLQGPLHIFPVELGIYLV